MSEQMSREEVVECLKGAKRFFLEPVQTAIETAITLLSQQEKDNPHASLLLMIRVSGTSRGI